MPFKIKYGYKTWRLNISIMLFFEKDKYKIAHGYRNRIFGETSMTHTSQFGDTESVV